jgi:hypothetical protein
MTTPDCDGPMVWRSPHCMLVNSQLINYQRRVAYSVGPGVQKIWRQCRSPMRYAALLDLVAQGEGGREIREEGARAIHVLLTKQLLSPGREQFGGTYSVRPVWEG